MFVGRNFELGVLFRHHYERKGDVSVFLYEYAAYIQETKIYTNA